MNLSELQAKAATLKKTGRSIELTGSKPPEFSRPPEFRPTVQSPSINPPALRPKPKKTKSIVDDFGEGSTMDLNKQRSQTLKLPNKPRPYQNVEQQSTYQAEQPALLHFQMQQPTTPYQTEQPAMEQPPKPYQKKSFQIQQQTSPYQAEQPPMPQPPLPPQRKTFQMQQPTTPYQTEQPPMEQPPKPYQKKSFQQTSPYQAEQPPMPYQAEQLPLPPQRKTVQQPTTPYQTEQSQMEQPPMPYQQRKSFQIQQQSTPPYQTEQQSYQAEQPALPKRFQIQQQAIPYQTEQPPMEQPPMPYQQRKSFQIQQQSTPYQTEHQPYQAEQPALPKRNTQTPTTPFEMERPPIPYEMHQSIVDPSSSVPDPEEAYDDIESVKEQMQSFINKDVPPPLPPPNVQRPDSSVTRRDSFTSKPVRKSISGESKDKILILHESQGPAPPLLKRPAIPQYNNCEVPSAKSLMHPPPAGNNVAKLQSESLTLEQFMGKFRNKLPLQVRISQKVPGKASSINKGDVYNVHFIKSEKVAKIETSNGQEYTVPLNSAIQFGIIYNPIERIQDAIQGYLFNTVSEIMSTPTVPSLVYAQKSFDTSSIDGSVQAGEVLAVKDIQKQFLRGKQLNCVVMGTDQKKKLLENCEGCFSTAPSDVKVYLPDLVNHIALPKECVLYYGGVNSQDISSQIPQGVITLKCLKTEESLIVSKENQRKLLDLSLSADIQVEVLSLDDASMATLKSNTLNYSRNFSAVEVDSMSLLTLESFKLQKQVALMSPIRYEAFNFCETRITVSQDLKANPSIAAAPAPSGGTNIQEEAEDDDAYQFPEQVKANYEMHRQSLAVETPQPPDCEYDIPQVSSTEEYDIPRSLKMQHTATGTGEQISNSTEHAQIKQSLELLQEMVKSVIQATDQLKQDIMVLQQKVPGNQQSSINKTEGTPQENRMFLYTLTPPQVQHMLKEMRLQEYAQNFSKHGINGSVLCKLDEASLHSLGVLSKLHKLRIMNVIEGRASARVYFDKDPYVKCYKP